MRHIVKFIIGFFLVFFYRLIPFRPANVEPLLATVMPFGKRFGWLTAALFAGSSMLLFDLATAYGRHTWPTVISYAVIAGGSAWFFRNRAMNSTNAALYSIPAIILFDFLTGPLIPSLQGFGTFTALAVAQIPFTIAHLAGGVIFAAVLTPLLDKYVVNAPFWELNFSSSKTKKAASKA